jgi:hypothetical protein
MKKTLDRYLESGPPIPLRPVAQEGKSLNPSVRLVASCARQDVRNAAWKLSLKFALKIDVIPLAEAGVCKNLRCRN